MKESRDRLRPIVAEHLGYNHDLTMLTADELKLVDRVLDSPLWQVWIDDKVIPTATKESELTE